jgi:dTMP kinase
VRENNFPGTLIVVEGADGSGASTQARKLADHLDAYYTAEHGERRKREELIGRKVEEMISEGGYDPETVALSFAADRMVHLEELVIPKLKNGETVVSDRYYHSSLVYQPVAGADFGWVKEINRYALRPDLTLVMDLSADEAMSRIDERGPDGNIYEELDFQEKVVIKYRQLSERLGEEIVLVDASRGIEEVFSSVEKAVDRKS